MRILIEREEFRGWDLLGLWQELKGHSHAPEGHGARGYVGDKAWQE
jgi:hypothetical protein